jgi:signal transduction histidine kinase/ActR/RegA family two-component response regulator
MELQSNPQAILFGTAAAIAGGLAAFAWSRRGLALAPAFAVMMTGEAVWALAEALEVLFADMPTKSLCYAFRIVGTLTAIVGVLALTLRYTGNTRWLERSRFSAVCAPAVFLVLLAWTDPWHHLYWSKVSNQTIGSVQVAIRELGAGAYVGVTYVYLIAVYSLILLGHAALTTAGVYRSQAIIMFCGVLIPFGIDLADWWPVFTFVQGDVVSLSFVLTGLLFLPGLYRFRLLDLTPVAWAVVVKGMNDPVVVIDRELRIVELNVAAARLAGQNPEALLGADAATAFAHWPTLAVKLKELAQDHEAGFELDGPPTADRSLYDAKISRLGPGVSPSGWVLVMRDISEHKRAAEERVRMLREQAARAQAEAANRAKDRFLATVSHELRTPLTPVLATVTALADDPGTPESLKPLLEMIRRNVTLEARLIDDLLDLARIGRGTLHLEREITDAHQLIDHVIEICQNDLARGGLKLVVDLAARHHHVDADPIRFQQVLWNLIKNAIKFTPTGGTITVRSHDHGAGADAGLDVAGAAMGPPSLVIDVIDTGIGIEPQVLPFIFDIRANGSASATQGYGGLGIGLTIGRSIVEQHGGRLKAASRGNGQGAVFTIEVPSVAAPAAMRPEPPKTAVAIRGPEPIRDGERLRILLVDDNVDTLRSLTLLLAMRGLDVVPADSQAAALALASEAEFDVLVSDIELPDGSGLELISRLRDRRTIAGIALSGFGAPDDIKHSLAAGFAIHLIKPVDFRRLERAIREVAETAKALAAVKC